MNIHRSVTLSSNVAKTKIIGSGVYLPPQRVRSDDIFEEFHSSRDYGIPTNWMSESMGIVERRMSDPNEQPSTLAIKAAINAFENTPDVNPSDIGLVLFCGIERDQPEPATAHRIQQALGLKANMAFDISNACFGVIDGIRIAENFIKSGATTHALVTTGEIPTRLITDFVEQLKAGMSINRAHQIKGFLSVGDAGGALIIGPADTSQQDGFNVFHTRTNSNHMNKCYYKHEQNGHIDGQMLMAQIVVKTVRMQKELYQPTLDGLGWKSADFLLTHQVGKASFEDAATTGIAPKDKMIKSYDVLGNVTSATFPVNHHQLTQRSDLKQGDRVYCCYSGSGIVIGQFAYTI